MQRPDLSSLPEQIVQYIEYLEAQLVSRGEREKKTFVAEMTEEIPAEPATSMCLFTLSRSGYCKRTYRHLYSRQHRAGMGVFDLDAPDDDSPALLSIFDENQTVLLMTNKARVFRYSPRVLEPAQVRAKGVKAFERLGLEADEQIVAVTPEQASGYLAFVSEFGYVRLLRHHLFGEYMKPGTQVFNAKEHGQLAAACWTTGDADLFVLSRAGIAIRFNEKSVPPQGTTGLKLGAEDRVVSVTPVWDDSSVFMLSKDGKGTARLMSGFAANKAPGGSGKLALKSQDVVCGVALTRNSDLFMISRASKIIRFPSDEVPLTEGVVQGVNCMALRQDEIVACVLGSL